MPNGTKYQPGDNIPGSRLRYGKFANGGFSNDNVSFWRNGTTNTSPVEIAYYNSSNNGSSTVPGTWKLLGPGCMGYISGNGSSTYGLLQRVL
jgi:hypothetical protein